MNKVSQVNKLHKEAMSLAEEVYIAQRKKDMETAEKWSKASFELEKKAAMLLVNDYEIEPTRSVLFKGAACLAINAKLYREAERMIGFALSGNPPVEISEELRNLLIEIHTRKEAISLEDQLLSNQIYKLPKEMQKMVKDFIDFLIYKQSKRA